MKVIYKKLISSGAKLTESTQTEFEKFITAVKENESAQIKKYLETNRFVNKKDPDGHTAIYYSIQANELYTTLLLLMNGARFKFKEEIEVIENNKITKKVIKKSLLDDDTLNKTEEMKTLLSTFEQRKKNIDTLLNLEKQISILIHTLDEEKSCSATLQAYWQVVITTYMAALSAGCFYLGFYSEASMTTAMTGILAAITRYFLKRSKDQPQVFENLRRQLTEFITSVKPLLENNTNNYSVNIQELEEKINGPKSFLTITDTLASLKLIFSLLREQLETDPTIKLEKTNSISEKFSSLNWFPKPVPVENTSICETFYALWARIPRVEFSFFSKTSVTETELNDVVVISSSNPPQQ